MDSNGLPLANATYTITFRLYDALTGGNKLWEERHDASQSGVPVTNGTFTVVLGSLTALDPAAFTQPLWLTIQLEGEAEMSPRQQLTSVPFALTAAQLDGPLHIVGDNVGIGTTAPLANLDIQGSLPNHYMYMRMVNTGTPGYDSTFASFYNASGPLGLIVGQEGTNAGQLATGDIGNAGIMVSGGGSPLQLGGNQTVSMTLASSGNVGIGTTAPGTKLHVESSNLSGASGGIPLLTLNNTTADPATINFKTAHPSNWKVGSSILMSGGFEVYDAAAGVDRLAISTSGNVGIGTTAPSAKLDVQGGNVNTSGKLEEQGSPLLPAGAIILWSGSGCPAGYTRLSTYDNLFLVSASTAGTTGGSNTHDHGAATGSTVLTIAQTPAHTHNIVGTGADGTVVGEFMSGSNAGGYTHNWVTESAGGGGGHTHPIVPADSRPAFKTVLLCQKD